MGAGADRIRAYQKVELSPLGETIADLLNVVWNGIYHLPASVVAKTDWCDRRAISVVIPDHNLATWDFNYLTKLVVLCHDAALRMEIEACNFRYVRLVFSQRKRTGGFAERHPTLEEAAADIRGCSDFPVEHGVPGRT